MAANGSPPPVFESDDERTSFVIRLPVHARASVPKALTRQVTEQVTGKWQGCWRRYRATCHDWNCSKHRVHFNAAYLTPALTLGLVEMTLPDVPRSSKQRYRLTAAGHRARGGLGWECGQR